MYTDVCRSVYTMICVFVCVSVCVCVCVYATTHYFSCDGLNLVHVPSLLPHKCRCRNMNKCMNKCWRRNMNSNMNGSIAFDMYTKNTCMMYVYYLWFCRISTICV